MISASLLKVLSPSIATFRGPESQQFNIQILGKRDGIQPIKMTRYFFFLVKIVPADAQIFCAFVTIGSVHKGGLILPGLLPETARPVSLSDHNGMAPHEKRLPHRVPPTSVQSTYVPMKYHMPHTSPQGPVELGSCSRQGQGSVRTDLEAFLFHTVYLTGVSGPWSSKYVR